MLPCRLIVVAWLLAGNTVLLAAPSPQAAPAPAAAAASAWKPFQEFGFLLGSWTGTSESGKRIGGAVVQATSEMDGNYISFRGLRLFPEQEGRPEETNEEVGYFFYDRDKRRYLAHLYFSSGVVGIYDVEAGSGMLKLTSSDILNFAGAKSRISISRTPEGLVYALELAVLGKEFFPLYSSKLTRK